MDEGESQVIGTAKEKYKRQLLSDEWLRTRERILHRAGGACEYCGDIGGRLEVHHEKYIGSHPSDTQDEFLRAVCGDCHATYHFTEKCKRYADAKARIMSRGRSITNDIARDIIDEIGV